MNWLKCFAVVFGLTVALPSTLRAAEAKIENYSNNTIFVAQADNKTGGKVSHGWTAIKSNATHTFKVPDAEDLYLRVESGGKEITFSNHTKFLNFPTHAQRFTVNAEPDDVKVWVLKWGNQLEHSRNINKGGAMPEGWSTKRYFHIGSGNHKLEVKP